jgi:hypothetical protein
MMGDVDLQPLRLSMPAGCLPMQLLERLLERLPEQLPERLQELNREDEQVWPSEKGVT